MPRFLRHHRRAGGLILLGILMMGGVTWLMASHAAASVRVIGMAVPHAAGTIVVDARAGRAVIVGGDRRAIVSVVDTRTGLLLHTVTLGGPALGDAAVVARTGRAFVLGRSPGTSGPGDMVSIFDTRTGLPRGSVRVPFAPVATAVDERPARVFVVSQGGLTANRVTPLGPGMVSALDGRTGAPLWHALVGRRPTAIAVDARTRRAFVVNAGLYGPTGLGLGSVSVLDTRTGAILRTVTVNKAAVALAIDEGTNRVFVAHEDSHSVSMLDARTGAVVVRTIPVGFATALAVDAPAQRVVVANAAPGTVSLLDAATGVVLHTIQVGGDPAGVAIDTRAHRAIVTGTGTTASSTLLHRFPLPFGHDDSGSYVTTIDTLSGRVLHEERVARTRNVAIDERAGQAFVVNWDADNVSVLDTTH